MLTMLASAWASLHHRDGRGGEGLDWHPKESGNLRQDVMIVFGGRTSMASGRHAFRQNYSLDRRRQSSCQGSSRLQVRSLARVATTPGAQSVHSGDIQAVGALPPFTEIRSITVAQGRLYNEQDNANARNVAFLGSDAKKQLFADRDALARPSG